MKLLTGRRTTQEMGIDARKILERIITAEMGETITYDELTSIIGRNVQRSGRAALTTARRACLRERMVFEAIPNVGIKRINDAEIVLGSSNGIRRIRSSIRRTTVKLACANTENLTNEERVKLYATQSLLGALDLVTHNKKQGAISEECRTINTFIPTAKTLELFSNKADASA